MSKKMKAPPKRKKKTIPAPRNRDEHDRVQGLAPVPIQNTIAALPMESLHWELYDRVKLRADENLTYDTTSHSFIVSAPRRISLFVEPIGMNGKTLADSNFQMPGQLPNPNTMRVDNVSLELLEDGRPVDENCPLWWKSFFQFVIGCKPYLTIQAHVMRKGPVPLVLPFYIEEQQNFYAEFETQWIYNPKRNFEVICRLSGALCRCTL